MAEARDSGGADPVPRQTWSCTLLKAETEGALAGLPSLYLERDDNHEDLLVFIGKDVLNEGPASANERDGDEQEGPFQAEKENVEQTRAGPLDSPSVGRFCGSLGFLVLPAKDRWPYPGNSSSGGRTSLQAHTQLVT